MKLLQLLPFVAAAAAASINITSVISADSPKKAALLPSLLIGNDGTAATGGVVAWDISSSSNLTQAWSVHTGRTKLVSAWNGTSIVTLSQEDSYLRVLDSTGEVVGTPRKLWGDFSAVCGWREKGLLLLFAKEEVMMVRFVDGVVVVVSFPRMGGWGGTDGKQVATWEVPIEAQTCGVSETRRQVYFSGKKNGTVYTFPLAEATAQPNTTVAATLDEEVQGIAVYHGKNGSEYLFMAHEETLQVFNADFNLVGDASFADGIEVGDIALYQPESLLAVQMETDDGKQFGVSSFAGLLKELGIEENTGYDSTGPAPANCEECGGNGFCADDGCDCFEGYEGDTCSEYTCVHDCSGHGNCTGNGVCACEDGWDGPDCSFFVVTPSYETDPVGEDGDDPAIWIHPSNASLSRIITTTKSTEGAGLTVFDLSGKTISNIYADEPNNVDVIYGFPLGATNRTVDLAYAACRGGDTLCLFEISSNGTLLEIAGGSQPTPDDYTVYGSCVYSSQKSGKHYLFVNSKTAEYLQYELTSTANGTLVTTLVRTFQGGSGGQVEGCVGDDENGAVFIGEEPRGLWRYEAEPDGSTEGVLIDSVDGHMYADIEGVTLVNGKNSTQGFVIVSCQGVSAYNVYDRAPPNTFRMTFTIHASADGQVDGVTNTDGLAAVGKRLNADFPYGLLVTHDDVNQNPDGTSNPEAAFKLVSLETVLKDAGLLDGVDQDWDPRAA
jgi:3-phytase